MLARLRPGRLFLRVFVHGLVVLVAAAAAFAIISFAIVTPAFERNVRSHGSLIASVFCEHLATDKPPIVGPNFTATAYAADGTLLKHIGPQQPFTLSPTDRERLAQTGWLHIDGPMQAFTCAPSGAAAYVAFGPPKPTFPYHLVWALIAIVLIVALASVPFARSISAPIERFVATVRTFGEGNLSARAPVRGKDEMAVLALAFNEMAERLENLMRAEKALLANISHELRTPLARIRVVLETAYEDPVRTQALLEEMGRDLSDLEQLVAAVLDTIRFDLSSPSLSGRPLPFHSVHCDITQLAKQAVDRFRTHHPNREVEVDALVESFQILGDEQLLRRLIDNLLENADKFSHADLPIRVGVRTDAEGAILEISDRGMGISSEDLPRVFDSFYRGASSRQHAIPGVGLGLALAKSITEAHNGTIQIASTIGVGTTVTVSIARTAETKSPEPMKC